MMAAPYFINNKEECGNGFLRIDVTSTYYIDKRSSYHHSHDHHHTYLHSHGSCSPLSLSLSFWLFMLSSERFTLLNYWIQNVATNVNKYANFFTMVKHEVSNTEPRLLIMIIYRIFSIYLVIFLIKNQCIVFYTSSSYI